MLAIGAEQQVTRAAARWQLHRGGIGRSQWPFRVGLGIVAVGKHLVRAQVLNEHVLAIRRRHHRVHMVGGLALGVDPAGRVPAQLHRCRQLAFGVHGQNRQAAARIFQHRIVGDEQVAPIGGDAGMGRLAAQALHLIDERQLMILRVDAVAAHAADRVFLARAVFIDHEQTALVPGDRQPRRVGRFRRQHRLALEPAGAAVELQAVDPFAAAGGVAAHQQFIGVDRCGLHRHRANAAGHQQGPEFTHHHARRPRRYCCR